MTEERPRCQDTINGEPCEGHLTVCTRHPHHDSHKQHDEYAKQELAKEPVGVDITFSNDQLLPLTRLLLQKLDDLTIEHKRGGAIPLDDCTTLSLYAKITFDQSYGPHVMVIDVDTSDLDFTDKPEVENCIKCDARIYDNPEDELCDNCRKDDKKDKEDT